MSINTQPSRNPVTGKPHLRYEPLAALLASHIPLREYLIEPWLKESESAMIYAAPGVGKSMLTMTLALCISGGGSFMGWRAKAPRKVLFIDGEMNRADLQDRAKGLCSAVDGINVEAAGKNLIFLARQSQDPDASFPDLATPEGQKLVLTRARRGKYDLVILDNFSTLVTCEDENSAAAFNDIVRFLMRLKQAGVACLLVHHTNKGGQDYRGSSKLATTFEVIMGLRKDDSIKDDAGAAFEIEYDKFRGKRRDEVTTLRRAFLQGDHEQGFKWSTEKAAKAHLLDLVRAVKSMKFANQSELAEHLGVTQATISKWLTSAINDAKLIKRSEYDEFMKQAATDKLPPEF